MAQHHDTVREELEGILDKLQDVYRRAYPGTVLLFAASAEESFTTHDVSKAVQSLAPPNGASGICYQMYAHNMRSGNQETGTLRVLARHGQIDIEITDRHDVEKALRFKMKVGFGGRVIDYEVQGTDGKYRPQFQKDNIIQALEQTFSG